MLSDVSCFIAVLMLELFSGHWCDRNQHVLKKVVVSVADSYGTDDGGGNWGSKYFIAYRRGVQAIVQSVGGQMNKGWSLCSCWYSICEYPDTRKKDSMASMVCKTHRSIYGGLAHGRWVTDVEKYCPWEVPLA